MKAPLLGDEELGPPAGRKHRPCRQCFKADAVRERVLSRWLSWINIIAGCFALYLFVVSCSLLSYYSRRHHNYLPPTSSQPRQLTVNGGAEQLKLKACVSNSTNSSGKGMLYPLGCAVPLGFNVTECYTEELDQEVHVGDDDHAEMPPDAYDNPVPCAKQPPELSTSFGYLFAGELVQLEEAVMAWLAQFAMRSISNVDIVHVELKQEFVYFVIDMPGYNIRTAQPSLDLNPGGKLHAWIPLGDKTLQAQLLWTPLKMVLQG
jgi:hypothetical protein